ncbi:hypothetical protein BDD12DRAFT_44228 [Trichophaea hybrida]|nr:hypothetical protein BDD12DRAFT_44228 [Trichophaea hybrida]
MMSCRDTFTFVAAVRLFLVVPEVVSISAAAWTRKLQKMSLLMPTSRRSNKKQSTGVSVRERGGRVGTYNSLWEKNCALNVVSCDVVQSRSIYLVGGSRHRVSVACAILFT